MRPIICIGAANIDVKLKACTELTLATTNAAQMHESYGGVARNVAANLANVTHNVALQCVIGDDAAGRAMLDAVASLGVSIAGCKIMPNHATTRYFAILSAQGDLHCALAAMALYDQIPLSLFANDWQNLPAESLIFLDTNFPANLLAYAIECARQHSLTLCIDPVGVAKAQKLPHDLTGVYLIKPDRHEAAALTGIPITTIESCYQAGQILLARGVTNVVISLGAQGYVVVNHALERHVPVAVPTQIQDVTGAGDAFCAGIMAGLQQGQDLMTACALGARLACLTIQSSETVIELTQPLRALYAV